MIILFSFSFCQVASDYLYTSPETAGLAGSNVACKGGAWALFHNPSALVYETNNSIVIGNSELFGFSFLPYQYIGFIFSNEFKNIGFSYEKSSVTIGNSVTSIRNWVFYCC